ncbi:glycine-rich protein 1-like [Scaptodrosophila lebanonensis]|uniref:Glycine-rich protein 1-like n=1 Tax=Drosophila lebanonensis TaxID=7225 RepID=A0A6J2TTH2_DROLE|nr:glycine-rich protein 1-like [Scaptodrosophila lebanonensis]
MATVSEGELVASSNGRGGSSGSTAGADADDKGAAGAGGGGGGGVNASAGARTANGNDIGIGSFMRRNSFEDEALVAVVDVVITDEAETLDSGEGAVHIGAGCGGGGTRHKRSYT